MEFNQDTKNLIINIAVVAGIACGMNYVVMENPDRSLISWSVGLFVVAVLFWIWMRRDDVAEGREDALKAADEAAKQAEALAAKAEAEAKAQLNATKKEKVVKAEDLEDYTEDLEAAIEEVVSKDKVETAKSSPPKASGEPDDLSVVEGIGPKYRQALFDANITTYEQVAGMTPNQLEDIIKGAGMRRPASIETWAEQATYAAKGDWDGLEKFQKTLDGGRRK